MKKKDDDPGKIIPSGPFKGKRLELAPQDGIDHYDDLAYDLISRVFDIKAYLVTDESSLWDFCDFGGADKKKRESVFQKILELYGVDVSDIPHGNLLAVCQRIARLSLHGPPPVGRS